MKQINDKTTVNEVYTLLDQLGCCLRCIVRFLGVYVNENETAYKCPDNFFSQYDIDTTQEQDQSAKKIKKNCCPACLGCFDSTEIECFAKKLKDTNIHEYNYNTYMLNVSFPKCFMLRMHSIFLYLKEKFSTVPLFNVEQNEELCLEHPHKIFRLISAKVFGNVLGKDYSPKSNLTVLMVLGYDDDKVEIKNLEPAPKRPNKKKARYEKRKPKESVSRNEILEIVKNAGRDQFEKYYSVPPEIPSKGVFVEDVSILTEPIYLGGRYLKFKRNVGQTPWIVDGVSLSEHNLQAIVFDAIEKVAGISKSQMTFTSSGREDVDVRMLGTGRPFYIKIDKSKNFRIPDADLLKIQEQVLKTELAAVIKLQHVYASEIKRIKFGEEEKKKSYRALCHTKATNVQNVVDSINKYSDGVDIVQTTALRVLHRRTLMPRERRIYSLKATAISSHDDLFELELETQAGTYVKEFVHGDFDRTVPSISSIVGFPTDIIALDCTNVRLEWPEDEVKCNIIEENSKVDAESETVKIIEN